MKKSGSSSAANRSMFTKSMTASNSVRATPEMPEALSSINKATKQIADATTRPGDALRPKSMAGN